MRPARSSVPKEPPKQAVEVSKYEKSYPPIICLKNSLEGIIKRIECQIIARLIMQWGRYDRKIGKIKFIGAFSRLFSRTKLKIAFEKLKRERLQIHLLSKAANNFALLFKRLSKGKQRLALHNLKEHLKVSKIAEHSSQFLSAKNPKQITRARMPSRLSHDSSHSHILSVSDDSEGVFEFYSHHDLITQEVTNLRTENEELKKMRLNAEVRESLLKMQEFDRYRYNIESERILKGPITSQLKRLQRMRNEQKEMHGKHYDNELTITCLSNYIKLIGQMNQQLHNSNTFKNKISELDEKMHRLSAEHRKEISQFQNKLVFAHYSEGKDKGRESSINKKNIQKESISLNGDLTAEELTTFNILLASLRTKKYTEAKRQIEQFIKQSKKQQFVLLLKELLSIIQQIETTGESSKIKEKQKNELLSSLSLLDKYMRTNKTDELEKIKNKSKSVNVFNQFYAVTDTVFNLYTELHRLRRKESSSAEKEFKSAEKDRLKKTVQNQNEELRKELRILQFKCQQLQTEKNLLIQNAKKNERPKPSIVRRNTLQKETIITVDQSENVQALKRYQQNELVMQKKIDSAQKEIAQINSRHKLKCDGLEKRYGDLQSEMQVRKSEISQMKASLKQFEDGVKLYGMMKSKKILKTYQRQLNEFKKYFRESLFFEFFQNLATRDEANEKRMPEDGNEKQKIKQFEEGARYYSIIKSKRVQKQQVQRQINQFKKVYPSSIFAEIFEKIAREDAWVLNLTNQIRTVANLFAENGWKRKQNILINQQGQIYEQLNKMIQTMLALSKEREETAKLSKEWEKQIQSAKKRQAVLAEQNEQLREELNKIRQEAKKKPTENVPKDMTGHEKQLRIKVKQLQDGQTYYQNIKTKISQNQPFQREIVEFKKQYSQSVFIDIFEDMSGVETTNQLLIKNINNTVAVFSGNAWKKKSNMIIKQEGLLFAGLNKLIQKLLSLSKEKQQLTKIPLEQNKEIQTLQQNQARLNEQNSSLKEQIQTLALHISKVNEEMQFFKGQISRLENMQGAQKESKTIDIQSQMDKLRNENEFISFANINLNKQIDVRQQQLIQSLTRNQNHQQRIKELESQLTNFEEKIGDLKGELQRVNSEKDNLKLMMQQKNQDYEMAKENVENHQKNTKITQEKMIQLKRNLEQSDMEIKKIRIEVERLLSERGNLLSKLQTHELQIKQMKILLNKKEWSVLEAHKKLEDINLFFKNQQLIHENMKTTIEQQSQLLMQQSNSVVYHPPAEDKQKAELRKQLQLVNEEATNFVRSIETEKREMRGYIQKLTNEMQMQSILHSEQKKILREDVERARNEEYEINYDKIRKMREDIQVLRQENQRLTSIIDSNEGSFNKLIREHQEMHQRTIAMQGQIQALHRQIQDALVEKQTLIRTLQPLEQKLVEFQNKIVDAMQEQLLGEEQMKGSQSKAAELQIEVWHLKEEKGNLERINQENSRELIEMHERIIEMQTRLNGKSETGQPLSQSGDQYWKYLQQKLKKQQEQLKKCAQIQLELTNKIQRLMRTINDLERQKMHELGYKREKDLQFALLQGNHQKQMFTISEKSRKAEESAFQLQKELAYWRGQYDIIKEQLSQSDSKAQLIQEHRQVNAAENNRLKTQVADLLREKHDFTQRVSDNTKMSMQNKTLIGKLTLAEQQANKLLNKLAQRESQLLHIKQQNEVGVQSHNDLIIDRGIVTQKQEELMWMRTQLNQRDQEIHRLRSVQIDLSNAITDCQQQLHRLKQSEQRYLRDSQIHQQIKNQFAITEQLYKSEIKFARERQVEDNQRWMHINYLLSEAQRECKRLTEQNDRLENEMTSISPASRNKMNRSYLREMALQLDYKQEFSGEQEQIELKILHKISQEISELMESNRMLKIKCSSFQKQVYDNHTQVCQEQFAAALHRMVIDLLNFIQNQSILHEEISYFSTKGFTLISNSQTLISDVGLLLKDLITQISKQYEEQNIKHNSIIREIKLVIEEYLHNNNKASLIRLSNLLNLMN